MKTLLLISALCITGIAYGQTRSEVIYTRDSLGNYVYNKKAIDKLIADYFELRWQYKELLKKYNQVKKGKR